MDSIEKRIDHQYGEQLRELLQKHHFGRTIDPGGARLTHPVHGSVRINEMYGSNKDDYYIVVGFLRDHGVEP